MKHPTLAEAFGTDASGLAERIGDLKYDELAAFLDALARKLKKDAATDAGRGRPKLAELLRHAGVHTRSAFFCIREAWRICAPYM